jgi:hypothetical protein
MDLRVLRFRFTEEQDVAAYGDSWWVWDEKELARLRGRELIALEELIDMPLFEVRRLMRIGSTLGTMAAMWVALHRAGHPGLGTWADFNPAASLTTWEAVPEVPLVSGEAPAPGSGSSTAPPPSPESVTS